MSFDPSEDEETGPCNYFCLWTHLHGWRWFALTKNKGFWILWIVVFMVCIILTVLNILGQPGKINILFGMLKMIPRYLKKVFFSYPLT